MSTVEEQLPNEGRDYNEKKAVLNQAMAEYQHMNTAFWDMIQQSINFKGAYELIDTNATSRFKVGELRDGVGLYFYVTTEIVTTDPIAEQIEAQDVLAKFPKLGANDITQVQLETHMHGLYRAFIKVEGNDRQFGAFRTRLLASLPDEPVNSKVVLVRQWLIDAIGKRDGLADTPEGLIKLGMRAASLNMPKKAKTSSTSPMGSELQPAPEPLVGVWGAYRGCGEPTGHAGNVGPLLTRACYAAAASGVRGWAALEHGWYS